MLGELALAASLGALFGFAVVVLVEGAIKRERPEVSLAAVAEDREPRQSELAGVLVADEHSAGCPDCRPAVLDLLQVLPVSDRRPAFEEISVGLDRTAERVLLGAHDADITALVYDHFADFDAGLVVEGRLLVAARNVQGEPEEQQVEWRGRSMSHGDRRLAP